MQEQYLRQMLLDKFFPAQDKFLSPLVELIDKLKQLWQETPPDSEAAKQTWYKLYAMAEQTKQRLDLLREEMKMALQK